ncbi:NAD(P)H-binding protein [Devosia sp. MC532]|nr:NAD(P)H-binding protein [Devosia sp. MC532]
MLVLGAVGRTGRHVVTQAVSAGHQVTALARDPE